MIDDLTLKFYIFFIQLINKIGLNQSMCRKFFWYSREYSVLGSMLSVVKYVYKRIKFSDLILFQACTIIALMTRHMSSSTFSLVSRAHGVGIFSKSEGMGVYPENANLRDTAQCRGRLTNSFFSKIFFWKII